MTTPEQVGAARPEGWHAAAAALRRLAGVLADRADAVDAQGRRLRAAWTGPAAVVAAALVLRLRDALAGQPPTLLAADQVLSAHADRVTRAQRALSTDPAGSVALAAAADAEAAAGLRALLPDLKTIALIRTSTTLPCAGTGPAAVRRWWTALSRDEQRWLVTHEPTALGRLDGVPAAVRDQANRLRLRTARTDPHARAGALHGLAVLAARLDRDEPARAYLLDLDTRGAGRAVVAVGDPDQARDVVTLVPGVGTRLASVAGLLAETDRLAARADTATVLWLGYDAPHTLVDAVHAPSAAAEADLDRFTDGLRATHEGPRAHQTVVGHSYGSTLVGYTARTRGLDADDVVFLGSPGVGAAHASDLNVPRVWASTATYDPIRLTGVPPWPLPHPDLWFGADPSRPAFGGQVFSGDPGSPLHPLRTHDGYLDTGNDALDDVAAIVRGEYGKVR
jgi:hypothetical protein